MFSPRRTISPNSPFGTSRSSSSTTLISLPIGTPHDPGRRRRSGGLKVERQVDSDKPYPSTTRQLNVSSKRRKTSAGTGAEPHIANRNGSVFNPPGTPSAYVLNNIESIVATEPNEVI